ncbi:MAG: tetratricopeptide repeat protein [Kiritimatiellia bacterium]
MNRAQVVVRDLSCLLLALSFLLWAKVVMAEQIDVDAILQGHSGAAAVPGENGDESALSVIAKLEQLLDDREAIILQLSAQVPVDDVDALAALRAENVRLAGALAEAVAERDKVRADFDRLFEDGKIAAAAPTTDAALGELQQLRARLATLEGRLTELNAELADTARERDKLSVQLAQPESAADDQFDRMKADLADTRQALDGLRQALEVSQQERDQFETALQEQGTQLEARLQAAVSKQQVLSDALEQSEQARMQLQRAFEDAGGVQTDEGLRKELDTLRALDASRRVTMDELLIQVGSMRDAVAEKTEELTVLREQIVRLEKSDATQQKLVQERNDMIDALRGEIQDKENLLAGTWEKIEAQAQEMQVLRASLAQSEQALSAQDEKVASLTSQQGDAAVELATARSRIDALDATRAATQQSLAEARAEIATLYRDMERNQLVEERRRRMMDETLATLATTEEREAALLVRQAELTAGMAGLELERNTLTDRVAALEAQASEKQQELTDERRAISELRVTVADRQQELADITASRQVLLDQHAKLQEQHAAVLARTARLEGDLSALRGDLADRDAQLETMRAEWESTRLVDDRRRRTLDETLASLALAEQRQLLAEEQASEAQARLATVEQDLRKQVGQVTERNRLLEVELTQMETDLKVAQDRMAALAAADGTAAADQLLALQERNRALKAQLAGMAAGSGEPPLADPSAERERILVLERELELARREIVGLQNVVTAQLETDTPVDYLQTIKALELQLQEQKDAAMVAGSRVEGLVAELAAAQDALSRMMSEQPHSEGRDADRTVELTEEMSVLRTQFGEAQGELERARSELERVVQELEAARRIDIRQTDLYRDLEENSAIIRDQLVETEANRQRMQRELEELRADLDRTTGQLAALQAGKSEVDGALQSALEREEEYRALLDRLMPEVRSLEESIADLRREREALGARLLQREDDIAALHVELEKREHRLARAERVAEVLERTRTEVEETQRRQRLNMHYNMASVYARDGRFAEAEQEYLQALRLDPTDADIHYNLGILYDDELGQRDKAILHYRRYLQLNPHGVDADRVRSWLMRLEVEQRR